MLTYIDYDLDLVLHLTAPCTRWIGTNSIDTKKSIVTARPCKDQIESGLRKLRQTIRKMSSPFVDGIAYRYFEQWKQRMNAEGESS